MLRRLASLKWTSHTRERAFPTWRLLSYLSLSPLLLVNCLATRLGLLAPWLILYHVALSALLPEFFLGIFLSAGIVLTYLLPARATSLRLAALPIYLRKNTLVGLLASAATWLLARRALRILQRRQLALV